MLVHQFDGFVEITPTSETNLSIDGTVFSVVDVATSQYPAGPRGHKGEKGESGDVGQDGAKGDQGEDGPIGEKGPPGYTGSQVKGAVGDKGNRGDNGDAGDTGPKGFQGSKGAQGPKGDQGQQVSNGAVSSGLYDRCPIVFLWDFNNTVTNVNSATWVDCYTFTFRKTRVDSTVVVLVTADATDGEFRIAANDSYSSGLMHEFANLGTDFNIRLQVRQNVQINAAQCQVWEYV